MTSANGPSDPSLWLTRKTGCWESELLSNENSDNILLNTWIKSEYMDPAKVEQAYRAMIYNQPIFRADVRRDLNGTLYFVPATDFSDVFQFFDQSDCTDGSGYAGCWGLAEELADINFSIGSGAPLNKCYLVKRPDGYNLLNKLHHGIGDGTTSFRVVNEVLRQYDLLMSRREVDLSPAKVLPAIEELSLSVKNDEVLEKLVQSKLERAQVQQVLFPLNMEEVALSKSQVPFKNRTLHATGTKEGLTRLRSFCKRLGVTVGAYTFAVLILAEAAVYVRRHGGQIPLEGIPTIYMDVLANLRTRLEETPGECFMYGVGDLELKETVNAETRLLDLAKSIAKQLQISFDEQRIPLSLSCKQKLETGEHSDFFNSIPAIREFTPSSKGVFNHPTKYSWGEVQTVHSMGSYWSPDIMNQVILYHSVNGSMCYSVVCCDGNDNVRDAQEVFELFVHVVEHSEVVCEDTKVMDFVLLKSPGDDRTLQ